MINILDLDNKTPQQSIAEALRAAVQSLRSKEDISDPIANTTIGHIWAKYPGSKHWDPRKVHSKGGQKNEGTTDIDIAGAARAYHDIDIYPVRAKSLAIPLHRAAYGVAPKDVPGLFVVPGRNVLAVANGTMGLTLMYALSKHVHQTRDKSLLPSDKTYLQRLAESVVRRVESTIDKTMK